jgi:alpha-amylase/alpha-mannosidase (GH57 family)
MHQPLYRDLSRTDPKGAYPVPWVRLSGVGEDFPDATLAEALQRALAAR